MDRSTAMKRLRKMLGASFAYRVNERALTGDRRAEAQEDLKAAQAARDEVKARKEARYAAILADAEYQALRAEYAAACDRTNNLAGQVFARKITVGTSNSLFFSVKAEGDSWEEIFARLAAREERLAKVEGR